MSRASKIFRTFAAADLLVLAYLLELNIAVLIAPPNPMRTQSLLEVLGLLVIYAVCLGLVRTSALRSNNWTALLYRIGIYGPYHKVAEFLTNIGSLPRIVAPINLSLNPTARLGERKPKKDEQFLEARMQIQTFVAHTSAKAPAGAGAQ